VEHRCRSKSDGIGGAAVDRPNVNPSGQRGVRARPEVDSNFIPASVNTSVAKLFLQPNTTNSDGGGRVIKYQLKFIF
jgi:hypothetical protein